MEAPSAIIHARLQRLLGRARPIGWRRPAGGYTAAERWIVQLNDGSSRFVKVGVGRRTSDWLRAEYAVYSQLDVSFMPRLLGWDDDGRTPILVLEDLSAAHWPPPWEPAHVEAMLHLLDRVHATRIPVGRVSPTLGFLRTGWDLVSRDPLPFLSTGACSRVWLEAALPSLLEASSSTDVSGEDLLHLDIRSDNVCFAGSRAVLVDWNWAARGNRLLDLAFWLPGLAAEGGPPPDEILPDAPGWAALASGAMAARAGLTPLREAERVQAMQRRELSTALPWAARMLGLPPPDGRVGV